MQKDCKNTTEITRASLKKAASDLLNAPSACAEAKTAAQNWLDAAGTDEEAEQTRLRGLCGHSRIEERDLMRRNALPETRRGVLPAALQRFFVVRARGT